MGGGKGGGGGGSGGSGARNARNGPSIVHYRHQRGKNERFRGKKQEKRVNKEVAGEKENAEVLRTLMMAFGAFVVGCVSFLIIVYAR